MIVEYLKSLGQSYDLLVNNIRFYQGLYNNGQHGYHFIVSCLKILYPNITQQEIVESITDGPYDQHIDTIVIKNDYVDIYDFKGNQGYRENDIRLFKESIKSLFFTQNPPDNRNQRLVNRLSDALVAIDNGARIRIRVARTNPDKAPNNVINIIEELAYDSIVEYKIYSGSELINKKLKINTSPLEYDWEINAKIENQRLDEVQTIILRHPNGNDTIDSLFCRLSLKSLVDLYYSQNPNDIIFESNVRGLQNDRKIKAEMLESLSSGNKAKKFHKLHNGITIVCDSISNENDTKFVIKNPQVVNGCQTITNLSLEFKNERNSNKLKNGSVLCKIFNVSKNDVERICLASNSQVSINPWDLRTNDPIQKKIESYLNMNGIAYNRKAKRIGSNDLTFVELGKWLYATLHKQPMVAKNKRRIIFDATTGGVYHKVFHDNLTLSEVLHIVKDGIYVRKKIRQIDTVFEKQADLHILTSFFLLRNKNWKQQTKFNKSRVKIRETIKYMKDTFDSDMSYVTMFAKKSETWQNLEPRILSL